MARRDNHAAARALADWAREGFRDAATLAITDKYKVTTRTLWRWKAALDDDPELSGLFRDRLNDLLDGAWVQHLDAALQELVEIMRSKAKEAEATLTSVTDAFRALSEVVLTREVLGLDDGDARYDASGAPTEATANGRASPLN